MSEVAIIGAGLIGRAWAVAFARAGHRVAIWDATEGVAEAATAFAETALRELAANRLLDDPPETVRARMTAVATVQAAVADAAWVQESTPEVLEVKRGVLATLDAAAPAGAILASSTSAFLPSALSDHLAGRHRFCVAHPINPPYLIPACELVPAPWTDAATMDRAADFLTAAGQKPIRMQKELEGFVMNRMLGALLEEAFRLVADGYASPEDVDVGIREGLALRWSFMGPFETIDLNAPGGVRDYVLRYQSIYAGLAPSQWRRVDWAGPVLAAVEADRAARLPRADLAQRQVWRDRRLMALAAHKRRIRGETGD